MKVGKYFRNIAGLFSISFALLMLVFAVSERDIVGYFIFVIFFTIGLVSFSPFEKLCASFGKKPTTTQIIVLIVELFVIAFVCMAIYFRFMWNFDNIKIKVLSMITITVLLAFVIWRTIKKAPEL